MGSLKREMERLKFVLGMLALILLTLAIFSWIVHTWLIRKENGSALLPRFMGATVHFAVPGWLILVTLNAYAKQWISELEAGNINHLLLAVWALGCQ